MKPLQKIPLFILLGIAIFVGLYFAAAFCCSRISIPQESGTKEEVAIYIKTNGAHTDIVVPVKNDQMDWSKELEYANNVSNDTNYKYVGIGWGDKGFYMDTPTWADLKFSTAFKAAFWLSTTAMHATYYSELIEDKSCIKISISKAQYSRLIAFISQRFQQNLQGHFINIKTTANYGDTDAFYEAKSRYNLFYTCNTWANDALAACGQRHCLWTIFDKGIFLQYPEN